MLVIHVLRKPLSEGSVASNILKHGTGGMNIDRCRIGVAGGSTTPSGMDRFNARLAEQGYRPDAYTQGAPPPPPPSGRWPANLILQHQEGCEQDGTMQVRGAVSHTFQPVKTSKGHAGGGGSNATSRHPEGHPVSERLRFNHADDEGMETVSAWDCTEDCPVKELDEQVGIRTSGKLEPHHQRHQPRLSSDRCYGDDAGIPETASAGKSFGGDKGTVSRFFKQVGGAEKCG